MMSPIESRGIDCVDQSIEHLVSGRAARFARSGVCSPVRLRGFTQQSRTFRPRSCC
jgi:hypothetical protein